MKELKEFVKKGGDTPALKEPETKKKGAPPKPESAPKMKKADLIVSKKPEAVKKTTELSYKSIVKKEKEDQSLAKKHDEKDYSVKSLKSIVNEER